MRPIAPAILLAVLLMGQTALAQDGDPDFEDALNEQEADYDDAEEPSEDWPYDDLELGLTVFGMGGSTAILDDDGEPALQGTGNAFNYPVFSSTSFGGGLALSTHVYVLMAELAVAFSKDSGTGLVGEERVEIGQNAMHVSVLVGFLLPFPESWDVENLRVGLGVGYDLIFPFESSLTPDLTLGGKPAVAKADFYNALMGALKIEVLLPTESDLDLRLVTQSRLGYSPGLPTEVSELVKEEGAEVVFRSEFQVQFHQTMGLAIYFQ